MLLHSAVLVWLGLQKKGQNKTCAKSVSLTSCTTGFADKALLKNTARIPQPLFLQKDGLKN
jgi:hypothetical protein